MRCSHVQCRLVPVSTEPICAVGQGVSALCCVTEGQKWIFGGYSFTGVSHPFRKYSHFIVSHNINGSVGCFCFFLQPSVFELVRQPDFANLPLVVEDFVKDNGGSYTGGTLRTSHLPR